MGHASIIGDLLDPRTSHAALARCTDDDLLIAAIARNTEPIYPGTDELYAGIDFARFVLAASSDAARDRVLHEALRWVCPEIIVKSLTEIHGYNPNYHDDHEDHSWYLARMPHGEGYLATVCRTLLLRARLTAPAAATLVRLLALCSDREILAEAARHTLPSVALAAARRLEETHPERGTRADL